MKVKFKGQRSRSKSKVKGQGQRQKAIYNVKYPIIITLRKSSTFRKVYWSVPFVCLHVCLSVCLSHLLQATVWHRSRLFFLSWIRHTQLTLHFLFVNNSPKVKVKVTKNHKNNYLSHNFWIRCRRDFWLVEKCSLSKAASERPNPGDIRSHVFSSRDVKENITVFLLFLICFWKYSHISKPSHRKIFIFFA